MVERLTRVKRDCTLHACGTSQRGQNAVGIQLTGFGRGQIQRNLFNKKSAERVGRHVNRPRYRPAPAETVVSAAKAFTLCL